MSKNKNLFEERINEKKRIHEELLKNEKKNIDEIIKSEKYNLDTMLTKTGLGGIYHDLIDSKDKMNSEYQSKYNQTYHSIDVELYKLNKKIDRKTKMINYKYNSKKDKIFNQIINEIM